MSEPLILLPPWTRDLALLALRATIALVFVAGGRGHLADPDARAKDLGLPRPFVVFLGWAEIAGGLGVGFGVLAQPAAFGLILVMLGAVHRKALVWRTGLWGPHGTDGWHYDLLFVAMNGVVLAFGPGRWALWK